MSKPLVVSIPHHLGQQEALHRLQTGIEHLKQTYAGRITVLEDRWTNDRLDFRVSAMSQTITGSIEVGDEQVTVAVQLPLMLALLADKAKGMIQTRGHLMLEKK